MGLHNNHDHDDDSDNNGELITIGKMIIKKMLSSKKMNVWKMETNSVKPKMNQAAIIFMLLPNLFAN